MGGEDSDEGVEGEVAIVFLIDGVELVALHEAQEILDFDDTDAVLGQEDFEAGDKVVQIGNVRENVVGHDQVGTLVLSDDFAGGLLAEKFVQRVDAVLLGGTGDVSGGLDAKAGNVIRDKFRSK